MDNNYGMKPPTENSLKRMPIVGYVVVHRKSKETPDYLIECNLNRQAFSIAISGRMSSNVWCRSNWANLTTKKDIERVDTWNHFDYYLFNTFEEMIEKFPFFYDRFVLLQPPSDLTQGLYQDRRLNHVEYNRRKGMDISAYRRIYGYNNEVDTMIVEGSNVYFKYEVNK